MMVAPPGRADGQHRPAVAEHDRRAHRGAGPLAGGRQVGVGHAGEQRDRVEVGQLVVEQEPVAGDDDAAAAGLLDGQGVADHVAPAVGDRQVGGGRPLGRAGHRHPTGRAAGPEGRERVAGRHRADVGASPIRQRRSSAKPWLSSPRQGHVDVAGVADPAVAVGEGQPGRLQVVEQGLGAGLRPQVVALQDVEGLADGGAAAGRRAHAVDLVAAVADPGRGPLQGPVGGQVVGGHQPGPDVQGRGGVDRRVLDGPGDRLGDPAPVERTGAVAGQQPVGAGQVGVAQHRPDRRGRPAGQEQLGGRREGGEAGGVAGRLVVEGLVDHEAALGHPDGRPEELAQGPGAVVAQRPLPGGQGARHPDPEAAGDPLGGRDRRAGGRVDEAVLAEGGRGGLAAVDGDHPALAGQVDDHEPAAADAGRVGLGDPQGGGGRDRGVDGVAAVAQHLEAGRRGVQVDGGDRPAGAGGDRLFDDRGAGRGGRDGGRDQAEGEEEGGQQGTGGSLHRGTSGWATAAPGV